MNKIALTAATSLLILAACEEGEHDHEHAHDDQQAHAAPDPEAQPAQPAQPAPGTPVEATVGDITVRLEPSADTLHLKVTGQDGQAATLDGDARVVLTGTGEDEQRVVLKLDGDTWMGTARAAGAPGYIAVVSFSHGGTTQTARLTWGDVPALEPTPVAEPEAEHDEKDDHAHGHGHGH
jgi:hypothetical protein